MARLLLGAGADVKAQDSSGTTALMEAVSVRDFDMAKLLMRHGADVKIKDSGGKSAIDLARKRCNQECLAILTGEAG